ncbi:MAG TPA: alpha/beta fold hydrolase [Polyangiales bacterium]|nr:alpha/beta fold hydrolase [Polyangiales bacterium]
MGVEIFHEEVGEGAPLVLLHGLTDSHRTWRSALPGLSKNHRVLVPDLPGCGLSSRPDASYTLEWQAEVMAAWLDALGLSCVDVVGHSYGGGVAQYMLLLRPQRIRRLVLVAAGGLGREVSLELRLASVPKVVERFGQPVISRVAAHALRAVGGVLTPDGAAWMKQVSAQPGTARAFARTVADVIDWRGQRRHFLDRAQDIRTLPPVAIFWGTRDRVIPYAHATKTLSIMQGAKLIAFEDCGHFPHHQRPMEFASAVLEFVDAPYAPPVRLQAPAAARSWTSRLLAGVRETVAARAGVLDSGRRLSV